MTVARLIVGDVFDVLRTMPDASVDLVVSSPPFLALRSYLPPDHPDKAKEIGSEATPADFIDTLIGVAEECRRVLAPHGSLCFELGDTFSGSGGAGGDYAENGLREGQSKFDGSNHRRGKIVDHDSGRRNPGNGWPLDKSLCFIPELFGASLAYGRNLLRPEGTFGPWRIRNLVRWVRPNPPVGALGDKFRPATSTIIVATMSRTRWFDMDAVRTTTYSRRSGIGKIDPRDTEWAKVGLSSGNPSGDNNPAGAPLLDWWSIPTQPYKGSHYACVDDATEALTPTGWKGHADLNDGDLIAAYDMKADSIRWEPAKFVRYDVEEEHLVAIDKEQTSQWLTKHHRMLVRTVRRPEPFVRLAGDVTSGHDLMLAAPWNEHGAEGPGVDRAALLGWYIAEGHRPKSSRQAWISQSQTANPLKVEMIRSLLDRLGAIYDERHRFRPAGTTAAKRDTEQVDFVVKRGDLAEWLHSFGPKSIPVEVLGWTVVERRALFDALVDGDGHRRVKDGRMSFIQKRRDTADAFQALAITLGYRAVVKERRDGCHVVYVSKNRWVTLRGADGWKAPVPRRTYSGIVWCPQVSTTFWLARRDGKPFVTGNTFPEEIPRRLILSMCPEKVCTICGEPSRRIAKTANSVGAGHRIGRFAPQVHSSGDRLLSSTDVPDRAERVTLGWTDCGCSTDGSHWRPGVVLDPFGGSGTTGLVATRHGRDAILIDIDERNVVLAQNRVGMAMQEVEYRSREVVA